MNLAHIRRVAALADNLHAVQTLRSRIDTPLLKTTHNTVAVTLGGSVPVMFHKDTVLRMLDAAERQLREDLEALGVTDALPQAESV